MVNQADEPLKKVTLNLFESDVEYLQRLYGQGYTSEIRSIIRLSVLELKLGEDHE
jgi:hypothetical protein